MHRREFLRAAGATAAFSATGLNLAPYSTGNLVVQTPSGALRGSMESGVRVFRGVPFAAPPLGALRFRPTETLRAWSGVRDALRFAPAAWQPGKHSFAQAEDCLYLNIWAPEGAGPFPVFVWIHGGGFTGGTSFNAAQNGANFANAGIVCVTVAYRIGVFGFLDVSPLLGPDYAGSAENGLRDLVESLRWIQANIEAFGGDRARVTIGGESAGAKLTCILMGCPEARELFAGAVSESGGAERIWPQAGAEAVASGFAQSWRGASIATAAPESLIRAQKAFTASWPKHFPLRPELNSGMIPKLPVEAIAAGSAAGKRLLIGTNHDESALFVGPDPAAVTAADLGNLSLARFEQVFKQYRRVYPGLTEAQLRIRALTAEEYWVPSMRVLQAHLAGGGSAWAYRLDFAPQHGRLHGFAYHSEDVRLVWNDAQGGPADAGAKQVLEGQMHAAWVAFLRGSAPAAQGLPVWPQYTGQARETMIFDRRCRVESAPAAEELRLWDGVL